MKRSLKVFATAICVLACVFTISCGSEEKKTESSFFAMDTAMEITAYGDKSEEAIDAAQKEIYRLENILSAGDKNSQVGKINEEGKGTCGEDVAYLLDRARKIHEDTGGAFNIMIYPLMEKWGFISDKYKVPSDSEISKLLKLTNITNVNNYQNEIAFKKNGMKMDFGGIAKGYASSQVMDIFDKYKIKSGLINLGGNVHAKGSKPDGSKWKIGIKDPKDPQSYIGVVEIEDMAVITSGGYERYFEKNGKIYHHILNPKTGKPAEVNLSSVTIVSKDGTLADGLSTALFVMGKEKATNYWRKNKDIFDFIMVQEDGNLAVTEGILKSFSTENRDIEVIR